MQKIAIIGTGGFSREVLDVILAMNDSGCGYDFVGFIGEKHRDGGINGYPVIGTDEEINSNIDTKLAVVIGVGSPILKKRIREKYNNPNIYFPTIIHPSVIIGNKNQSIIGQGCVICAGTIMTTNFCIGDFVTLNLMCTVGHDTVIGDYSSFMPSVNISGEVSIGEMVYVGTGAKIINGLNILVGATVGAGAVVTKDVQQNVTVAGVPAKIIKYK